MGLNPNKKTICYPKQISKPKTTTPKTKLTKENYEKLRKLTGSGFTRIPQKNIAS